MNFFIKIILLTFTLVQFAQAGRYYDSEMGRFIQRDAKGYVDGYSLYNAYFAESFALDPSGFLREMTQADIKVKYGKTESADSNAETDPDQLVDGDIEISRAWWAFQGCDWELEVIPQKVFITVNSAKFTYDKQKKTYTHNDSGDSWDKRQKGILGKLRKLSTKDHEMLHAKNWMEIYNSQFVPFVNAYEEKYYDTYNDAVKVRRRIRAYYDFLYYMFRVREEVVVHPGLGQKPKGIKGHLSTLEAYAEEMNKEFEETKDINSFYHPNNPKAGAQSIDDATGGL